MSHLSLYYRSFLALTLAALLSATPALAESHDATAKLPGETKQKIVEPEKAAAAEKTKEPQEAAPDKKPAPLTGGDKTGKTTEEHPLTGKEKAAAIAATDKIGAFEADKVIGAPKPDQIYFQPSATPVTEQLEWLHDYVFVFITVITIAVTLLLLYVCIRYSARANPVPKRFAHNTTVEVIWTVIPILILVAIGIPSVRIHYKYTRNENIINNADLTLKVTGHQWYWSYEYPDMGVAYDSNYTKDKDLKPGEPRLLAVDNPVIVPVGKTVRVQMTSADVIHAWVVPSFGVDMAAVPGRLNETWFKAEKPGIYYGQCQQLCGKYHGFMPIMVKVVSQEEFDTWIKGAKLKYAENTTLQFAALN